jgi:hypothetical protein
MSSLAQIKSVFIQQLDSFVEEFSALYPEETEILLFAEKYKLIKSANSTFVVESFVTYVLPLKAQIMAKEESFFLSGGGQGDIKDDYSSKLRDIIKNVWLNKMSEGNKEIIWKYFTVFVRLSEKYAIELMKGSA